MRADAEHSVPLVIYLETLQDEVAPGRDILNAVLCRSLHWRLQDEVAPGRDRVQQSVQRKIRTLLVVSADKE